MVMRNFGGWGERIDSLSLLWCVKKENGFLCGYERRGKGMVFCYNLFRGCGVFS